MNNFSALYTKVSEDKIEVNLHQIHIQTIKYFE